MSASAEFRAELNAATKRIQQQMRSRCVRSSNELRNAAIDVLGSAGGGRVYGVPATKRRYVASAPGQPPAVRTGAFRNSWTPASVVSGNIYTSRIESRLNVNGYVLGELLENGTSKMAARPHHDKIKEQALPNIKRIYSEPYT